MGLRIELKEGETWDDVIEEEIKKAETYHGSPRGSTMPHLTAKALVEIAYLGGRETHGHFINKLLENDLMGVFAKADLENLSALENIVYWIYNVAPDRMCKDPDWPGLVSMYSEPPVCSGDES